MAVIQTPRTHRRPERGEQVPQKEPQRLRTETKHGIVVVVLFMLAALALLSMFDLAGGVGQNINSGLHTLFGIPILIAPAVMIFLGYVLMKPEKYKLRFSHYLGMLLFIIALTGFFHLFVPLDQATDVIGESRGGGYLGLSLSYPLQKIMGGLATGIVLFGLLIISLLLSFDMSLTSLMQHGTIVQRLGGRVRDFFGKIRTNLDTRKGYEEDSGDSSFSRQPLEESTKSQIAPLTVGATSQQAASGSAQQEMFPEVKRVKKKIPVPTDLLDQNNTKPISGDIEANKERIHKTLANFGIPVEMSEVNVGPTVTQYTLKPAEGVKLAQLTTLSNDLALALAAHPIRIEAPIPGKSLVGIEVPNKSIATVRLRQMLESSEFKKRKTNLFPGYRGSQISIRCRICLSPALPDRESLFASIPFC
ncbi:MAG: DNA translocase FtsK 4TM domain-containing protein [Patescibacteria group bacterium]|jgi:S-DNA-T family DNA segregation ATPase FtsK/SpoIIIE